MAMRLWMRSNLEHSLRNSLRTTTVTTARQIKYAMMRTNTIAGSTVESVKPVSTVRTMMPSTSSMTAAAMIAVPTRLLSLPISRSVSTVIETEVAVRTTPINAAFIILRLSGSLLNSR